MALLALLILAAPLPQSPGESLPPADRVRALEEAVTALLPPDAAPVDLTLDEDTGGPLESFTVQREGDRIEVRAAAHEGLARGAARALQLVEPGELDASAPLRTEPDAAWRGLMIDVARFPHTAQDVEDTVQLAWLCGLNRVHLHLTDDQLFTVPSEAFPGLASLSAKGERQHFTRAELDAIVRFADVRGIQLVPEVDVPAHAGVIVRARPDLFGTVDGATGEPRSTGVVNMANERAYGAIETLLGEIAEVFWNSEFIHVGADEVWAPHLAELPEYADYCARHELPLAEEGDVGELYCHFVGRVCEMVEGLGRRPIVWEGFRGTGTDAAPIPTSALVMCWNLTFQSPESLVANGYEVVNCGWDPMYVVPSQCYAARVEDALDWDVRTFRQRYGGPRSTLPADAPVLGGQICVWEQRPEAILPSALEPLVAVSERMWDPPGSTDADEHRARRAPLLAAVERALGERVRQRAVPAGLPNDPMEDRGYLWTAAWPIPRGGAEVLDPAAVGVRARGFMPVMTRDRARAVNRELFARVAEKGHVDTRIPAPPVEGLEWLPRRQWQPYALELRGLVWLPERGDWTFHVRANDGAAELVLGGATVATSRGNRPAQGSAFLDVGLYDLRVRYHFEFVQNELQLLAQGPGMPEPAPFEELLASNQILLEVPENERPPTADLSSVRFEDRSQRRVQSLATGRSVTTTAPHQGPHVPARAVDGLIGNESGWHCGQSPAALTVDLGAVHPIDRAVLHLYHDGARRYRYRVEASEDGEAWTVVADRSGNESPSTPEGDTHRFPPRPSRYVRILMLGNSANEGVHVNELLVYADGAAPK
ncbi:MAG: family 20 glycosylhydrolase [Planctomycetota bacterium]